jgi:hypothetical protein
MKTLVAPAGEVQVSHIYPHRILVLGLLGHQFLRTIKYFLRNRQDSQTESVSYRRHTVTTTSLRSVRLHDVDEKNQHYFNKETGQESSWQQEERL